MFNIRQLIDFFFHGRHRLETIEKLPLGSSLGEAIALYGKPIETEPSDDTPEITQHTFAAGDYHEMVASEWNDTIQSITYWSLKSDPGRDLDSMLSAYTESSEWEMMEEGYWYQRQDGVIRLWCSAIPAIGVAFVDFLRAKSELKIAHSLSKLSELEDVAWAPDDVVHELQRMYIEDDSDSLMEFSDRSDSIAVSPDGQTVLIVRDHHAYDFENGFMELNSPPDLETGYPSPVINVFTSSSDGSSWGKITLPRNANVSYLGFKGDRCILGIHQSTGGRKLNFDVPALVIRHLCGLTIRADPHTDEGLWKILEEAEAEQDVETNA